MTTGGRVLGVASVDQSPGTLHTLCLLTIHCRVTAQNFVTSNCPMLLGIQLVLNLSDYDLLATLNRLHGSLSLSLIHRHTLCGQDLCAALNRQVGEAEAKPPKPARSQASQPETQASTAPMP